MSIDKLSGVMDGRKAEKLSDRLIELNETIRGPSKNSSRKRAMAEEDNREFKRSKAKEPTVGVWAEKISLHQTINASVSK